jgi:hypothetical protein
MRRILRWCRRFQFVSWRYYDQPWRFGKREWTGSLRQIYRWSFFFGPFEIRRWESPPRLTEVTHV